MNIKLKIKSDKKPDNQKEDDFIEAFKEPMFDSGLNVQLDRVAKYLDSVATGKQPNLPEGYKSVLRYALVPPFCYATIMQSDEYSDMLYAIDELAMNEEERKVYASIKDLLEKKIDSPRLLDNIETSFVGEVSKLLSEHFSGDYQPIALEKVKYFLRRDVLGFGIIDPLFHDPFIEDITCGGPGKPIFVYHRQFEGLGTNVSFHDEEALDSFVMKMVHRAGKHISAAHPIVDASLPGNHRLAALYKKEVTTMGSSFTIRKFREDPITVVDLINSDTLDLDMAAYAWLMLDNKKSLMVIGSTGGGKTTILNAVTGLINPSYKIFSVEDVAEINIPHTNWFSLVSRASFGLESQGEIGLFDLLKSGMRHRPDYILVGEIRGEEAYVLFQAVATGHGGIATMHADDSEAAVRRLQQKPMDIPPAYVPLMNCVITVKRVKLRTEPVSGRQTNMMGRRVTEVTEVLSHNSLNSVFEWDPEYDGYHDNLLKSKHLPKIAIDTGVDINDVYDDLARRKEILSWLLSRGIRDYRSISKVIGMFNQEPQRLMEKVKST
ncbi:type II/IV secretion system ATPase subunit [Nitrososphaera sp.]|uniref:type II/IV secretion system ATPase subunit n=1 Tax=Nitrososphaera sp. TaxID=1971748 RepID=UPI0017B3E3AF|nr:type II/IV secretion system ATPase subunit [Nitrososphaera sp.]NWG37678.1 type II/IV secretion system ATPase subunit [Nitrososphaera sp.]